MIRGAANKIQCTCILLIYCYHKSRKEHLFHSGLDLRKKTLGPAGSQVFRFGRQHNFFGHQKIFGPLGQRFLLQNSLDTVHVKLHLQFLLPLSLLSRITLPEISSAPRKRKDKKHVKRKPLIACSHYFSFTDKKYLYSLRRFGYSLMCGDCALQFHERVCKVVISTYSWWENSRNSIAC